MPPLDSHEGSTLELALDLLDRVGVPFFTPLVDNILIRPWINAFVLKCVHVVDQNLAMTSLVPVTPMNNTIDVICARHERLDA